MEIVAEVHSIYDIHVALRARFEQLKLSRITTDAASGLADGYTARLLSWPPTKRFGNTSMWPTLEVAGLKMVLVEDPEAFERITSRLPKKKRGKAYAA